MTLDSDPSKSRFARRAIGPELGRALRAARRRAGLTLEELSVATGLSTSLFCSLEHGRVAPSMRTVLLLAAALELPPELESALRDQSVPKSWIVVADPVTSPPSRRFRRRLRRTRGRVRLPQVTFRAINPSRRGRAGFPRPTPRGKEEEGA